MKALLLSDIGKLEIIERSVPSLQSNHVLVEVKACGICGSDIPRAYTDGAHHMPIVLGHEFAGVVEAVADDVDKSWIGKRVGVFPLMPCKKCSQCIKQHYEMCENYSYLGSRTDGGFAEYVAVPEWNLIELPDEVTLRQAAMLEPLSVVSHAIRKAPICRTSTVAVIGLGAIGLLTTMLLKEVGTDIVYTIGNKLYQMQLAAYIGACPKAPEKGNVDVVFECVGTEQALQQAIELASPEGNIILVGNPRHNMNMPKEIYWKILRKQLKIMGTWNSSFTHAKNDDWNFALSVLENGRIHPERFITHEFPLEYIKEGFEIMRLKQEPYVKIMMVTAE